MSAPDPAMLLREKEKNVHLRRYLDDLAKKTNKMPMFYDHLSVVDLAEMRRLAVYEPENCNIIYRAGEGYAHIVGKTNMYYSIERSLNEDEKAKLNLIKDLILEKAADVQSVETKEDLERILNMLYEQSVQVSDSGGNNKMTHYVSMIKGEKERVRVTQDEYELLKYYISRDVVGFGPIEPLILDEYIEDISLVGTQKVRIMHKAFQYGLETNIRFSDEVTLNEYFISLSERMGRPVTNARPIVDGTLPDGSRINMIYSTEISQKGSSFTIRKFSAEPISPIQLIKFGTLSVEMAAYIWLCLENKINIMIAGETASGKTSTLNAILCFIDHRGKIYSVEDTPEVKPPQKSWQRCVTRESGPEESRVTMFDLLRAALRSRPDYIVIGEIRGEEARVAFQCMQTGIPVIATFHASTAAKFIQRMTGAPVNIPLSFIDNVNVIIFQSAVNVNRRFLRRVTNIEEFICYSREEGGVLTKNAFKWDSARDVQTFRGYNQSYILEQKIALEHGYSNKKDIYKDMAIRSKILQKMVDLNISSYRDVNKVLCDYYEKGIESLPFVI